MCTQQPQANVQWNLLVSLFNKINDCVDDDDVVVSRTQRAIRSAAGSDCIHYYVLFRELHGVSWKFHYLIFICRNCELG